MKKIDFKSLPLNALRAFVCVAKLQSVTKAAKEIGVSHAAISQHLTTLETYLTIPLFQQAGKRLHLTDAAKQYAQELETSFNQIEFASLKYIQQINPHTLNVWTPTSFALHWLIPRLDHFYQQHPEIELRIITSAQKSQFNPQEFDCAIYYSTSPTKEFHYDLLFSDYLYPVCNPNLLKSTKNLSDINWKEYKFIYISAELRQKDWPTWCHAAGFAEPPRANRIYFADTPQALRAALANVGIAMAHEPIVQDAIKAKQLRVPTQLKLKLPSSYYLITSNANLKQEKTVIFRRWLLKAIKHNFLN